MKECLLQFNYASIGGAIYNRNGTVSIASSCITGNNATESGGGIYNRSQIVVEDSICDLNTAISGAFLYNNGQYLTAMALITNSIVSNSVATDGGAFFNNGQYGNATTDILSCQIRKNQAVNSGGAISNLGYSGHANLHISNSNIVFNNSSVGGAIANNGYQGNAIATIDSSSLSNNTASIGGALYNTGGRTFIDCNARFVITKSLLSNNYAKYDGGAIFSDVASFNTELRISESSIIYNIAEHSGGAIEDTGSNLTIANTTMAFNQALGNGGTIDTWFSNITLTRSTVAFNSAFKGGAICHEFSAGTLILENSIIGNNTSSMGGPDVYGNISIADHSLISFTDSNTTILSSSGLLLTAPKLGPLGFYGGQTPTIPLLPDSPAIGAGSGLANATMDQRGYTPSFSYTGNADIGAFQSGGQFISITSFNEITMPIGLTSGISVIATGNPVPVFSVIAGNLPVGVSLDSTTGLLSGTPVAGTAGNYLITIQASNGSAAPANQNIILKVVSTVTSFTVSKGQAQRSYIRYLDLGLDSNASALMLKNNPGRVRLTKADLNGVGATNVPLAGFISVAQGSSTLAFDFGTVGLGNSRNTATADGYYTLGLDLDGNGTFETSLTFDRLFGDINGDGQVNATDMQTVLAGCTVAYNTSLDINGDGIVNTSDYQYVKKAVGRKIKSGLILTA